MIGHERIAQIRMGVSSRVSCSTRSNAWKSPVVSNSCIRATPRLRTWNTIPPGATRAVLGMPEERNRLCLFCQYRTCPVFSPPVFSPRFFSPRFFSLSRFFSRFFSSAVFSAPFFPSERRGRQADRNRPIASPPVCRQGESRGRHLAAASRMSGRRRPRRWHQPNRAGILHLPGDSAAARRYRDRAECG